MSEAVKIAFRIPKKTDKQLEWLKEHGYGSKASIIKGNGLVNHVLDIYLKAREVEKNKESG